MRDDGREPGDYALRYWRLKEAFKVKARVVRRGLNGCLLKSVVVLMGVTTP